MNNNMDNSTGPKILEKIKEGHIKPTPKWEFLLKDYTIWVFFGASILIGSLASSVTIFVLGHSDLPYYLAPNGLVRKILISLPYFWLAILVIFWLVAFYNLKHTSRGYKYDAFLILLASIMASLVLGFFIYEAGLGEKLEGIFYRQVPFYRQTFERPGRMLLDPDRDVVAGVIVEITDNNISIMDFRGKIWNVSTSTDQFELGQRVYLIGEITPDVGFEGMMIRPWFRPGPSPFMR